MAYFMSEMLGLPELLSTDATTSPASETCQPPRPDKRAGDGKPLKSNTDEFQPSELPPPQLRLRECPFAGGEELRNARRRGKPSAAMEAAVSDSREKGKYSSA